MKLIIRINKDGYSTLEMLIALAILVTSLAASSAVSLGSQSITLDAETNQEALYKAKQEIEAIRALSRENFNAVQSTNSDTEGIYTKQTIVAQASECTKEITSRLTWKTETLRPQKIELKTSLTDWQTVLALGDSCTQVNDCENCWQNPTTLISADITPSGNKASGIDVLNKIVYLSAGISGSGGHADFFIFDARNATSSVEPPILSSLNTTPYGLVALDLAGHYVYAANDSDTDQLQVIDVNDINNPFLLTSRTLPDVTGSCPYTCPGGRSVYFYKNKLYIGTHRLTAGGANEFHVYDVTNPTNPTWIGSAKINHNVNAIAVRDENVGGITKTLAFLATSSDTEELIVLDVTDPANIPSSFTTYNLGGTGANDKDATAMYLSGNRIYLGRERSTTNPDFFILDISNISSIQLIGSKNIDLNPNTQVVGIRVSGNLAFLAVNDPNEGFQVWDITNLSNITLRGKYNYSEEASGIDAEANLIYTSNEQNDALRIIKSN